MILRVCVLSVAAILAAAGCSGGDGTSSVGAAGGGRFCSSLTAASFCEDFDDPSAADGALARFSIASENSTYALDPASYASAPRALRVATGGGSGALARTELSSSFSGSPRRVRFGATLKIERLGQGRLIPLRFSAATFLELDLFASGEGYVEASTTTEVKRHPLARPFPVGSWHRVEIDADLGTTPGTVRVRIDGDEVASGPTTSTVTSRSGSRLTVGSTVAATPDGSVLRSEDAAIGIDDVFVVLE
jgi:hypothetical protein